MSTNHPSRSPPRHSTLLGEYDAQKAKELMTENFIQHATNLPTSRAPVVASVPKFKEAGVKKTIHRVLQDGDIVAFHSTYSNCKAIFGGIDAVAVFNVWRVDREAGKVVEDWNNLQPIPLDPNPSGHTMTDGITDISDVNKTGVNKEIMTIFFKRL
mmetsp:Transcript_10057/g.23272  ORF Transcript_10057/g.23272 Transcript_10057/m.23272 type:complete len:156 (-) Transcript_10057:1636-2103(-)